MFSSPLLVTRLPQHNTGGRHAHGTGAAALARVNYIITSPMFRAVLDGWPITRHKYLHNAGNACSPEADGLAYSTSMSPCLGNPYSNLNWVTMQKSGKTLQRQNTSLSSPLLGLVFGILVDYFFSNPTLFLALSSSSLTIPIVCRS